MLFPTSWKFYFHSFFHSFISFIHFYFWNLRAHYAWARVVFNRISIFYRSMQISRFRTKSPKSVNLAKIDEKTPFFDLEQGRSMSFLNFFVPTFTLLFLVISFPNSQKNFSFRRYNGFYLIKLKSMFFTCYSLISMINWYNQ